MVGRFGRAFDWASLIRTAASFGSRRVKVRFSHLIFLHLSVGLIQRLFSGITSRRAVSYQHEIYSEMLCGNVVMRYYSYQATFHLQMLGKDLRNPSRWFGLSDRQHKRTLTYLQIFILTVVMFKALHAGAYNLLDATTVAIRGAVHRTCLFH
jgi:hypothetical protein